MVLWGWAPWDLSETRLKAVTLNCLGLSELLFYKSLSQCSFCWTYKCFLGSPLNECPGNGVLSLMDSETLPAQVTVCEHMCIIEMCPVPAHLEAMVTSLFNTDLSAWQHTISALLYTVHSISLLAADKDQIRKLIDQP